MANWENNRSTWGNSDANSGSSARPKQGSFGQGRQQEKEPWVPIMDFWTSKNDNLSGPGFSKALEPGAHPKEIERHEKGTEALNKGWRTLILPVKEEYKRQGGPTHTLYAVPPEDR